MIRKKSNHDGLNRDGFLLEVTPVGPILLELGQCVENLKGYTLMGVELSGSANILDCRVLGTWGDIPRWPDDSRTIPNLSGTSFGAVFPAEATAWALRYMAISRSK